MGILPVGAPMVAVGVAATGGYSPSLLPDGSVEAAVPLVVVMFVALGAIVWHCRVRAWIVCPRPPVRVCV